MKRRGGLVWGILGLAALSACTPSPPPASPPTRPVAAPSRVAPVVPIVAKVTPKPDAELDALRVYYQRLQNDLIARGLLREDGGGPDTPFTDTQLARNFVRIALFDEYVSDGNELRAAATESKLRRWEQPVRMSVSFGDGVDASQRASDLAEVTSYTRRLSRLTGLPISITDSNPNYHVLFLGENERRASEGKLRALVPGIAQSSLRAILNLPRDQLCIVVAFSEPGKSEYQKAIAVIRDEHPKAMRKSCIHEELAQGLGLANDSPAARPSIFNDDEEFGLLTTHDELLLTMLYDRRLRSGMDAIEATPIVQKIATELTGGGAS